MLTLLSEKFRRSVNPASRRRLKRWIAPLFSGIGSIQGATNAGNQVGLTFDDGPDASVTPLLLDLLATHNAHATFFVLTDKATAQPALVRRMVDEGHEIALHFDSHHRLTEMPLKLARTRLRRARSELESLAGPIRYFRPPFGAQ